MVQEQQKKIKMSVALAKSSIGVCIYKVHEFSSREMGEDRLKPIGILDAFRYAFSLNFSSAQFFYFARMEACLLLSLKLSNLAYGK